MAAAVAAGWLSGCFVDIDNYYGTTAGATAGTTTAGATTATTSGIAGTTSAGPTTDGPTTSGSGGASTGEATLGTTGVTSGEAMSTGAPATTEAMPVCPAFDAFNSPHTQDPACASCLREQCCPSFEACEGACVDVWGCAQSDACLADWAACPGWDANKLAFDAATDCMNAKCKPQCAPHNACGAEDLACDADPECKAIGDCSVACTQGCAPDDANCTLGCWGTCKDMHPNGGPEWDAFWSCIGMQCP